MDEIRKKHIVKIPLSTDVTIDGVVLDYTADRVMVLISNNGLQAARNLKELDEISVYVHTFLGIKKMISTVISELNDKNCIVIENAPSSPVVQKRRFVRVLSSIKFDILKGNKIINCVCVNISAGGIAFYTKDEGIKLGEIVKIKLFERDFEKDIVCRAEIIKYDDGVYVAKFFDLNKYDEDKIVKHVFKLLTAK